MITTGAPFWVPEVLAWITPGSIRCDYCNRQHGDERGEVDYALTLLGWQQLAGLVMCPECYEAKATP